MSTTDPARERVLKATRQRGGVASLVAALVAALACLIAGYFTGWGIAGAIGTFRWMAFESLNSWSTSEAPSWLLPFFGGIFGGPFAQAWYAKAARRFTGGGEAFISGFALACVSFAFGLWNAVQDWGAPVVLGYSTRYGTQTAWGPYAWVMYYAKDWMPLLAAVVAVVVVASSLGLRRRRGRRSDQAAALLSAGRRVAGVVTEANDTGIEIQGWPLVSFTVRFTDFSGVDRWVTKKARLDPVQLPRVGQAATVVFDPQKLEEKDIAVILEPPDVVDRKLSEAAASGDLSGNPPYGFASQPAAPAPTIPVPLDGAAAWGPPAPAAAVWPTAVSGWGTVRDAVLSPSELGTSAVLSLGVEAAGLAPFTEDLQLRFAAGSPRESSWCRIGARIPLTVQPGYPPTIALDPTRADG